MPNHPTYPTRRRQRLPSYDYTTADFYFVTLCIHDRLPLFGRVVSDQMYPSPAGKQMHQTWEEMPNRYPGVVLDTLMVMPDHVHTIISLAGGTLSLFEIIHHLKARTTAQYTSGVRQFGWLAFHGTLWQRGFHDRVIRREEELTKTREYILQNPLRWSLKEKGL